MTRIEDIAKEAGVSAATVSRALNNTARVAPETRKAVLQASRKLGRVLDQKATKKRVLVICLPSGQDLLEPLAQAAETLNMSLLFKVTCTPNLTVEEIAYDGSFDGVILVDSVINQEEMSRLQQHVPVVECRNYNSVKPEVSVLTDDFAMGYDMTTHLIETGKTNISYVHFSKIIMELPHAVERYRGYRSALLEHGLEPSTEYRLDMDNTVRKILSDADKEWNALLFAAPVAEMQVIFSSLSADNHNIPNKLALAVLDDGAISVHNDITAIQHPMEAIARNGLFMLDSLMDGRLMLQESMQLRLKPRLVIRSSTVASR